MNKKKNNVILESFSAILLGRIIHMIIGFVQSMVLVRSIDKYSYGTYSQGIVIYTLISNITALGLGNSINYFIAKSDNDDEKKSYTNTIIGINTIMGALALLVMLIFNNQIGMYFNNKDISTIMVYICLRPLLINLLFIFQNIFVANKEAKLIAKRNIIISIFQFIVVIYSALFMKDIKMIFLLNVIIDILQVIYFLYYISKRYYKVRLFDIKKSLIPQILKYSIPLSLGMVSMSLSVQLDKLFITNYYTTEQFALYANASKELPISFIATSLTTIIMPYIIKEYNNRNIDKVIYIWNLTMKLGFLITIIIGVLSIVLSKEIFVFLYTYEYIEGINIFVIYIIVQIIKFTYFGMILNASGKTKLVFIYSLITLIINFILNMFFIRLLGFEGPAIATLISIVIIALFQIYHSSKILKCNMNNLLPIKFIIYTFIKLITTFIFIMIIKKGIYMYIDSNILIIVIISLIYLLGIIVVLGKDIVKIFNEFKGIKEVERSKNEA